MSACQPLDILYSVSCDGASENLIFPLSITLRSQFRATRNPSVKTTTPARHIYKFCKSAWQQLSDDCVAESERVWLFVAVCERKVSFLDATHLEVVKNLRGWTFIIVHNGLKINNRSV